MPHFHFPNRQCFGLGPLATHQRHHGPVGAQVLYGRSSGCRWSFALQLLDFVGLLGDVRGPSRLGVPPHRRFIQLHSPEESHVRRRLLERHLGPQSSHTFGQRGAQLARQQFQFFIQGEKDRLHTRHTRRSCGLVQEAFVVGLVGSCAAGGRVVPAEHGRPDTSVAPPPAAALHRRPCSRAPPAAALAPAGVGLPQTPRPRSASSWLSDAPYATRPTPAPLPRSSPASPATSARSHSRPWLLRPCPIGRPERYFTGLRKTTPGTAALCPQR